jgi:hypothetical protein
MPKFFYNSDERLRHEWLDDIQKLCNFSKNNHVEMAILPTLSISILWKNKEHLKAFASTHSALIDTLFTLTPDNLISFFSCANKGPLWNAAMNLEAIHLRQCARPLDVELYPAPRCPSTYSS